MALKGFFNSENYSVLSITQYNKSGKRLLIDVVTYQDESKGATICHNNYIFEAAKVQSVTDKDLMDKPALEDRIPGTMFIIGSTGDNYLKDFKDKILKIGAEGEMSLLNPAEGYHIFLESDGQHYMFKNGTWVTPDEDFLSPADWDARFSPEATSALGNNELKAAYEYLKTLPEWQHTVDA
jgi:hypothetical protein